MSAQDGIRTAFEIMPDNRNYKEFKRKKPNVNVEKGNWAPS